MAQRKRKERHASRDRILSEVVFTVIVTIAGGSVLAAVLIGIVTTIQPIAIHYSPEIGVEHGDDSAPRLDRSAYREKMFSLANIATSSSATGTPAQAASTTTSQWPVQPFVYPKHDAVLPFERIIAYYGNFYSRHMGILGKYEPDVVLERLRQQVAAWERADPGTPVRPAIHYIAVTAQSSTGADGMYRARMPADQIEQALAMAERIDGLVFLDIQVGLSSLREEIPRLKEYLKEPNVHLAIDPEFAMHGDTPPGHAIGSFDAAEINYATDYLADLVREHDLPPKMLIVHRFTQDMVTNYDDIERRPEVQFVMHMDGWGPPSQKRNTYRRVIQPEPVQFAGFKVFYENDRKPPSPGIMRPEDILDLQPQPIYIQYQ